MKKIWNWLVNTPKDKLLHVLTASVITTIAILIFRYLGIECTKASAYGWGVGFLFSIGKEIYDEIKTKSSESSDWAADAIGITYTALYSYLIMSLQ